MVVLICLSFLYCLVSCDSADVVYPNRKTLIESVYASGKIIAKNEHHIEAMNNGTVLQKLVEAGDTVKKGQLLYIVNREMQSIKVLSKDESSTGQNQANLSLLVTSATPTQQKAYIRSDIDGIIYQTMKEEGESVHAMESLVLIGDPADHLAWLSVDQLDIAKVKVGQLVLLKTDITGDTIFEAHISKIYPLMNEANQSFRVDVIFQDTLNLPFIHHSVEGNIVIQKKENAMVLPTSAVTEGDSVSIRVNDRPKKIKIKTGIKGIDFSEIISGLDEKTAVFINEIK
jgi:multidrug efflux pump subunit AcrA (membrane-fusion protein)